MVADLGSLQRLPRIIGQGLTRELALQWARYRIRVNAICPSFVETALTAAVISKAPDPEAVRRERVAVHPIGRLGQPQDIAATAQREAKSCNGNAT